MNDHPTSGPQDRPGEDNPTDSPQTDDNQPAPEIGDDNVGGEPETPAPRPHDNIPDPEGAIDPPVAEFGTPDPGYVILEPVLDEDGEEDDKPGEKDRVGEQKPTEPRSF